MPFKLIRFAIASGVLVVSTLSMLAEPTSASPDKECAIPKIGPLTTAELSEGANVIDCDAIGRIISSSQHLSLKIPPPGIALYVEEVYPSGTDSLIFGVSVSDSGEIAYSEGDELKQSMPSSPLLGSPRECGQRVYRTKDLKEYGTYKVWVGDGLFPAGLSRTGFQSKVIASADNIIQAHNNCGLADRVSARGSLEGWSSYESDMSPTSCGDGSRDGRDHVSVWDAGNLDGANGKPAPVARTCYWSLPTPGVKNDLLEADVRFNISNYDFTTAPNSGSCSRKYDVVSVGTHEAGHIYGLDHVSEEYYPWMTMSSQAEVCDTSQRTLGKGDVLGLESIY